MDRPGYRILNRSYRQPHRCCQLESRIPTGIVETSIPFSHAFQQSFDGHLLIEVRAAGSIGDEELQLEVNNEVAATWTLSGTNAGLNQFQTYSFDVQASDINQVRIRFLNDAYNPDINYDRNVLLDSVTLNGVTYQANADNVFVAGADIVGRGISNGYLQSNRIATNGFWEFNSTRKEVGSFIQLNVSGNTGDEEGLLLINGEAVKHFGPIPNPASQLPIRAKAQFSIDELRVAFINDFVSGTYDRNLQVNRLVLDGTVYTADDPRVFTTGHFIEGRGVVSGNFQVNRLLANGYFQFRTSDVPTDPPPSSSLEQGLIGFWTLDEPDAGKQQTDFTGNGNAATPVNVTAPAGPTTDKATSSDRNRGRSASMGSTMGCLYPQTHR